jgi:hypothetical protein
MCVLQYGMWVAMCVAYPSCVTVFDLCTININTR